MPNAMYKRGYGFENRILNKLKDAGYEGLRSAGSHSPVDIVVWDWNKTFLIQCKHSNKKDIDFNALFRDTNVVRLTLMPERFIKVLCVKQGRSNSILKYTWNDNLQKWEMSSLLNL